MRIDLNIDNLIVLSNYVSSDMFQITISHKNYEVSTPFALFFSKKIFQVYSIDKTLKAYEFNIQYEN